MSRRTKGTLLVQPYISRAYIRQLSQDAPKHGRGPLRFRSHPQIHCTVMKPPQIQPRRLDFLRTYAPNPSMQIMYLCSPYCFSSWPPPPLKKARKRLQEEGDLRTRSKRRLWALPLMKKWWNSSSLFPMPLNERDSLQFNSIILSIVIMFIFIKLLGTMIWDPSS